MDVEPSDEIRCPVCAVRFKMALDQRVNNCVETLRQLRSITAKVESRRLVDLPIDETQWKQMRDLTIEATAHLSELDSAFVGITPF